MRDKEALKEQIRAAFAHMEYPGDWCLRGSNEGDEPFLVERDFKGKRDWHALDPQFLEQSPEALCFFSDEAFHFYLPAYLIADIEGALDEADPVFHLTHGLTDASRHERINPRRYGERTFFDAARYKFAMFTQEESAAIVAYLRFRAESEGFHLAGIEQALRNYWVHRVGEPAAAPNVGPAAAVQRSEAGKGPPSVS